MPSSLRPLCLDMGTGDGWEAHPELTGFVPQQVHTTYPYASVTTFGGCKDDFMLVIRPIPDQSSGKGHVEKLIFRMAAPKVGVTAAKPCHSGVLSRAGA